MPTLVPMESVNKLPEGNWWTWKAFPAVANGMRKSTVPPKAVKEALDEYAVSIVPLQDICEKNGFSYLQLMAIRRRFPIIDSEFHQARVAKADAYGAEAVRLVTNEIPEQYWMVDKVGNKVPTTSGVRFMEIKGNMLMRAAQVAETGTFIERRQIESKNMNFNINTKNIDINDLDNVPIEALLRPDD